MLSNQIPARKEILKNILYFSRDIFFKVNIEIYEGLHLGSTALRFTRGLWSQPF